MNYLLTCQTLLDLCAEQVNAAQHWSREIDTTTLRVSVISIAQAQATVMRLTDGPVRARLDADLSALLAQIEADAGAPLEFERGHAMVWKALMYEQTLAGVAQTDRQVYATAMHEGLMIVEEERPASAALRNLGVNVLALETTDAAR
ncbi:MAG: hypothetical protein ACKVQK_30915 [Burkholderiales bacterium]